ncbi:MAG: hypothetical protein A2252_03095 [Elusimicrobia bacterium RIFOXYA2_FULL_39_19]|nr:MAG: hypothetical protein A2252_03095 [Elusimicrobia bacterium RIFOXYA2_FULL_39_19]
MISVIIPVYNDELNLKACLKSIFACTYTGNFEVVVYDDCSTDNSIIVAESYGCIIVRSEVNKGPGVGRNMAVKYTNGDILAFTDSDCVVPENWLSLIDEIFKDKSVDAAAGKYSVSLNPQFISKYRMYESSFHIFREKSFVNHSSSNNLMCRKETFFKSGGFGDRRIAEDLVFGHNLFQIGVDILLVPELTVSHFCKTKVRDYLKQQFSWLQNIMDVHLKYPATLDFKWPTKRGPLIFQLFTQISILFFIVLTFFKPVISILLILLSLVALFFMNLSFLKYVYSGEKHSISAVLKTYLITFARNYLWIAGAFKGLGNIKNVYTFSKIFLKSKFRKKL